MRFSCLFSSIHVIGINIFCFWLHVSHLLRLNRLNMWCYLLQLWRSSTKSSFAWPLLARWDSTTTGQMACSDKHSLVALLLDHPLSPGVTFSGFSYWLWTAALQWRLLEKRETRYKHKGRSQDLMVYNDNYTISYSTRRIRLFQDLSSLNCFCWFHR